MQVASETGTLWLTRASDVLAHLTYMCALGGPVVMSGPGFRVRGTFVQAGSSGLRFRPASVEGQPLPAAGTAVRADYAGNNDQYAFYSRFVWFAENGDWLVEAPRTVERSDRRLNERHRVARTAGVTFRITELADKPELVVHDVSVGGLAVIHEPPVRALVAEELLDGELNLPAEEPIRLCVEVRHVKGLGGPTPLSLVGLQITAITTVDRERLSAFLARRLRREA